MKVVIEDVKKREDLKLGDLVVYKNSGVTFIICEYQSKYKWVSLNSGCIASKSYDSLKDLFENEFDTNEVEIYSSDNYSLKLIEN